MWYDVNTKKLYTVAICRQPLVKGERVGAEFISVYLDWIRQYTGDELCLSQGKSAAIRNWPAGSLSILVSLLNLLFQVVPCKNKLLKALW